MHKQTAVDCSSSPTTSVNVIRNQISSALGSESRVLDSGAVDKLTTSSDTGRASAQCEFEVDEQDMESDDEKTAQVDQSSSRFSLDRLLLSCSKVILLIRTSESNC